MAISSRLLLFIRMRLSRSLRAWTFLASSSCFFELDMSSLSTSDRSASAIAFSSAGTSKDAGNASV